MINSKSIGKITIALLLISLIGVIGVLNIKNDNLAIKIPDYQDILFGDDILEINIEVEEDDWQSLLENPLAKEYISGDLTINGTKFTTVGIRTKGNSSLSQVAQMEDSNRYSLQFKSNKYVKGQTFYGLNSFCINNIISDTSYMKDYLAYDLMDYIGVDAPLTNYASVKVNGEDYGFYIALERYDKSFLSRVYNTSGGQLYNVKMSMGQEDNFMGEENMGSPKTHNDKKGQNNLVPPEGIGEEFQGMAESPPNNDGVFKSGGKGRMGDQGGGSLIYTDDNITSYSSIFDNGVFSKTSDQDKKKVIVALKNLNEGKDLEKYIDVDKTLRYLAAHTVLVNLDSYSSNMGQNYYLYEKDGKLTILPWDYNLSFGGFQSGNVNDVINFPIDTPVSDVAMEDRPLINKLLEVDEYKEKYHNYLQEIVDGYFLSGLFEEKIYSIDDKINEYVKNDTTSFTSYEKYQSSLPVLVEFGDLRAESINGQLNGSIPATTEEQKENQSLLVDASHISLSDLGGMNNGGFGGGNFEEKPEGKPNNFSKKPNNIIENWDFVTKSRQGYGYMGIIFFSALLLGGTFIIIFKRKKNY